jgi:aarF domain-containing kinase
LRRFHDTYAAAPRATKDRDRNQNRDRNRRKTRGGGLEGLVRAPLVLDELSTGAVLTMEWIDGARLTDVARLATAGVTPAALLDRGVRCSLHQLLETGFMHSDPHPGNLVVSERGELVYLDFGMVVEVPPRARRAMIRGLVGFVNRDASGVVSDLIELDFLPRDVDATAAAEALRVVFEDAAAATETKPDPDPAGRSRTQTPLNRVRGADDFLGVVSQLSAALSTRGFRLPPYFARILRALAALEGTATTIDRDFKVIERAYPYVLARVLADRSPEARESLRRLVLEPDGRSVRWSRVSRLARAYAGGGGGGNGKGKSGDAGAEEEEEEEESCAKKVAETLAGIAEGIGSLAGPSRAGFDSGSDLDSNAARAREMQAVADAVDDALSHVLSPEGAVLRASLTRDAFAAADRHVERLAREEAGEEEEEEEGATSADTSASSRRHRDLLAASDVLALVEAARKTYVRAPKVWTPVVAAAAAKREASEIAAETARGVAARLTRENLRLLARDALRKR